MRAVVQRVKCASVLMNGEAVNNIDRGLVCFIGLKSGDTIHDAEWLASKIASLRIFPDDLESNWKHSVIDVDGDILCVSNFTLYGRWKKSKPNFSNSMHAHEAKVMYGEFVKCMALQRQDARKVKDGVFGAMMDVSLVNDGPVTVTIDSDGTIGVSS